MPERETTRTMKFNDAFDFDDGEAPEPSFDVGDAFVIGGMIDGTVYEEAMDEKEQQLIRPPFRIVYRRDRNKIRVVRVWRSERLMVLSDA